MKREQFQQYKQQVRNDNIAAYRIDLGDKADTLFATPGQEYRRAESLYQDNVNRCFGVAIADTKNKSYIDLVYTEQTAAESRYYATMLNNRVKPGSRFVFMDVYSDEVITD